MTFGASLIVLMLKHDDDDDDDDDVDGGTFIFPHTHIMIK